MSQRTYGYKTKVIVVLFIVLFFVYHISLVSASSTSDFDEILKPLNTIYDLAKYAATILSGLMMLFAGIMYITSGSDPGKREKAKNMIMYVIIGLMVIWAAPFVVKLILGS